MHPGRQTLLLKTLRAYPFTAYYNTAASKLAPLMWIDGCSLGAVRWARLLLGLAELLRALSLARASAARVTRIEALRSSETTTSFFALVVLGHGRRASTTATRSSRFSLRPGDRPFGCASAHRFLASWPGGTKVMRTTHQQRLAHFVVGWYRPTILMRQSMVCPLCLAARPGCTQPQANCEVLVASDGSSSMRLPPSIDSKSYASEEAFLFSTH